MEYFSQQDEALKQELESYIDFHENYQDFQEKISIISELAGKELMDFCKKNNIDLTLPSSLSNVSPNNKYAFIARYVFATSDVFIEDVFTFKNETSEINIFVESGGYPPPKNLILKPGQKYMDLIISGEFPVGSKSPTSLTKP